MTTETTTETQSLTPAICQHLGIFAGEGELPVKAAKKALSMGLPLSVYSHDPKVLKHFKSLLPPERLRKLSLAELDKNYKILKKDGIDAIICAGKVNKWVLLQNPRFDKRALKLFNDMRQRSDDNIMNTLINDVESEGFKVLPQRVLLEDLFIAPGVYTHRTPSEEEQADIDLGFQMAREIARLDVGQSAVICKGMVVALETIEGTDKAIARTIDWVKKRGGVVAKVEKPDQDARFDIPTVGPRTLETMRKAGLDILAIEAKKTLVLELDEVIRLANNWKMIVIAQ